MRFLERDNCYSRGRGQMLLMSKGANFTRGKYWCQGRLSNSFPGYTTAVNNNNQFLLPFLLLVHFPSRFSRVANWFEFYHPMRAKHILTKKQVFDISLHKVEIYSRFDGGSLDILISLVPSRSCESLLWFDGKLFIVDGLIIWWAFPVSPTSTEYRWDASLDRLEMIQFYSQILTNVLEEFARIFTRWASVWSRDRCFFEIRDKISTKTRMSSRRGRDPRATETPRILLALIPPPMDSFLSCTEFYILKIQKLQKIR